MAYLNFFGVCFGALGAILILFGVFITPKKAVEAGGGFLGSLDQAEELATPPVQNLLRQSNYALCGTISLLIGFTLQGIAAWPF